MKLTSDQIAHFREHGYLAVGGFFTEEETRALQAETARLQRTGKLRNVATEGDGKTESKRAANLQVCPVYRHSDLIRALPFAQKVIDAVTALIGDEIILHLDQIFLKPGKTGMGTNWHQDNAYFKISDPSRGTAMWIAIHDATEENGTIRVVPDSFHEQLEHGRDPMSDHHIRCWPDEERAVPITLNAGGVAFFNYGTPHATGDNQTDHERAGLALHFLHVECAQKNLVEEGRDYRPYLTGPRATGGATEYGETVAGTWEAQVEKTLAG